MNKDIMGEIKNLSVSERIELVEEIWDSVAQNPEEIKLQEEQKQILDRRLDSYSKNKQTGSSWSEVKKRIRSKKLKPEVLIRP